MKNLEMAQSTAPLAEYALDVENEPLILTINRKLIAALVPIDNADVETVTLSTHPQFLALIERSRAWQHTEGGISSAEIRRQPGH